MAFHNMSLSMLHDWLQHFNVTYVTIAFTLFWSNYDYELRFIFIKYLVDHLDARMWFASNRLPKCLAFHVAFKCIKDTFVVHLRHLKPLLPFLYECNTLQSSSLSQRALSWRSHSYSLRRMFWSLHAGVTSNKLCHMVLGRVQSHTLTINNNVKEFSQTHNCKVVDWRTYCTVGWHRNCRLVQFQGQCPHCCQLWHPPER
jgi:hypothetical protein